MGERATDQRLEELKAQGNELYSISKLDSINNCLYGAYLTYRLDNRGGNNIYAIMGGKLHDVLEGMANGTATKDELLDYANRIGAPMEVIENLQEIEDEGDTYESIEDIWPDYPTNDDDFFFNEEEY